MFVGQGLSLVSCIIFKSNYTIKNCLNSINQIRLDQAGCLAQFSSELRCCGAVSEVIVLFIVFKKKFWKQKEKIDRFELLFLHLIFV